MPDPAAARQVAAARAKPAGGVHRGAGEWFEAWLVTGPVGHLAAFTADLAVLLGALTAAASRRRGPSGRALRR